MLLENRLFLPRSLQSCHLKSKSYKIRLIFLKSFPFSSIASRAIIRVRAVGERHDRGGSVFDVVVGNVRDDAFTAGGLDLDDVAEEITAEVVVVDRLLDDLSAGLFLSAPPPDHREAADAVGGQHGDFVAVDLGRDVALDEIERVGITALEADSRDELLLLDARVKYRLIT